MYMVMALKKSMKVSVMGKEVEVPFTSAGFVGMIPVFATKEEAEEWADGKAQVVPIEQGTEE
jgi:TusA-related sulfurtransferase